MEAEPADTIIAFDEFEVDPTRRLLLKDGHAVSLKPKAFELLLVLIDHRGTVLSKSDLFDLVWTDQFVEENNLTVHVAALRKALGEKKDDHRFIVTVPGQGYKFVAAVRSTEADGGPGNAIELSLPAIPNNLPDAQNGMSGPAIARDHGQNDRVLPAAASYTAKLKWVIGALALLVTGLTYFSFFYNGPKTSDSIAVLPFVNASGDPKVEYLSDGITESLINDLSQFPDLKVIARSSVFRYKTNDNRSLDSELAQIAADLGVQTVLTGRLEQRGENLLISVELVDVRNKTQIWGEHYDRKIADVFAVQEEIARNISEKLHVKLGGAEKRDPGKRYTDNIKAFENYTMGRAYIHRRTREDLLTAKGYYENAIDEDRNYALAYSGLAEVYGNLTVRGYIPSVEGRKEFRDTAEKAIALDDDLAEGHVMKGFSLTGMAPYNFAAGDPEFRRAIDLSPSLAIAHLYMSLSLLKQGKYDEGLREMLKARELDPFSTIIARQVALCYTLRRDNNHAIELLKQADETGVPFTTTTEVDAYVQGHLYDEASSKLVKEREKRADDPILIFSQGMIDAAEGKRAEAVRAISELRGLSGSEADQAQWIAKIYAQLGDKENALTWLERGAEANTIGAFYKDEPVWDLIHGQPRFNDIVRRLGIQP